MKGWIDQFKKVDKGMDREQYQGWAGMTRDYAVEIINAPFVKPVCK